MDFFFFVLDQEESLGKNETAQQPPRGNRREGPLAQTSKEMKSEEKIKKKHNKTSKTLKSSETLSQAWQEKKKEEGREERKEGGD